MAFELAVIWLFANWSLAQAALRGRRRSWNSSLEGGHYQRTMFPARRPVRSCSTGWVSQRYELLSHNMVVLLTALS
jgi:hypothetical protein